MAQGDDGMHETSRAAQEREAAPDDGRTKRALLASVGFKVGRKNELDQADVVDGRRTDGGERRGDGHDGN